MRGSCPAYPRLGITSENSSSGFGQVGFAVYMPIRHDLLGRTAVRSNLIRCLDMRYFMVVIALLGFATTALAQQRTIKAFNGSDIAFVWKDGDAMSKGFDLIRAGVHKTNPALLLPFIACIVHAGDHIVITDFGFGSSTIMVVDGNSAGCQGDLQTEFIGSN